MDNFKNHKEDKDLFPYEYGASSYDHMRESIFALLRREELASSIRSIYKHMEENGVVFSSPGASFKRKFCNNLSQYMNYRIRYPRRFYISFCKIRKRMPLGFWLAKVFVFSNA